jgi:IS5 family transposase
LQIFTGGNVMQGKKKDQFQQKFLFNGLSEMLDPKHSLYKLANSFPWEKLDEEFKDLYSHTGRPSKPTRLMISLLLLKQMYDLSDESVVNQWVQNPYYQYFSGFDEFQWGLPCEPSDLVHFRKRIGELGCEKIFAATVEMHGDKAKESVIIADTTVQEKNITFPTDTKLHMKVIEYCWKIADKEQIVLRQRYSQTLKKLSYQQRFKRSKKGYKKALKAQRKIKTIAGRLYRDVLRKLPENRINDYAYTLDVCLEILTQKKTDRNKVYSLHEPDVYCISKGKEHRPYEFGCKASILSTKDSGIIVGAYALSTNQYDGHTLEKAIDQYRTITGIELEEIIADRGYRGKKKISDVTISTPMPTAKKMSYRQKQRLRNKFRRRAAIEPMIGHLKSDNRMGRNFLKGILGDKLNVLLAASAYNLRKWMRDFLHLTSNLILKAVVGCPMCQAVYAILYRNLGFEMIRNNINNNGLKSASFCGCF